VCRPETSPSEISHDRITVSTRRSWPAQTTLLDAPRAPRGGQSGLRPKFKRRRVIFLAVCDSKRRRKTTFTTGEGDKSCRAWPGAYLILVPEARPPRIVLEEVSTSSTCTRASNSAWKGARSVPTPELSRARDVVHRRGTARPAQVVCRTSAPEQKEIPAEESRRAKCRRALGKHGIKRTDMESIFFSSPADLMSSSIFPFSWG
jgi:hypothetical protein